MKSFIPPTLDIKNKMAASQLIKIQDLREKFEYICKYTDRPHIHVRPKQRAEIIKGLKLMKDYDLTGKEIKYLPELRYDNRILIDWSGS